LQFFCSTGVITVLVPQYRAYLYPPLIDWPNRAHLRHLQVANALHHFIQRGQWIAPAFCICSLLNVEGYSTRCRNHSSRACAKFTTASKPMVRLTPPSVCAARMKSYCTIGDAVMHNSLYCLCNSFTFCMASRLAISNKSCGKAISPITTTSSSGAGAGTGSNSGAVVSSIPGSGTCSDSSNGAGLVPAPAQFRAPCPEPALVPVPAAVPAQFPIPLPVLLLAPAPRQLEVQTQFGYLLWLQLRR